MRKISAIWAAVMRRRLSASIASTSRLGKRRGLRLGREERSSSARSPSLKRRVHLAAVRTLQPAASAARCSVQPSSSTRRQIRRRLFGQVAWLG